MRESDFAGRHGGEEFLVLLTDTGLVGALEVAEKIHRTIGEILIAAVGRRATVSIGVAVYPSTPRTSRMAAIHLVGDERPRRDQSNPM